MNSETCKVSTEMPAQVQLSSEPTMNRHPGSRVLQGHASWPPNHGLRWAAVNTSDQPESRMCSGSPFHNQLMKTDLPAAISVGDCVEAGSLDLTECPAVEVP